MESGKGLAATLDPVPVETGSPAARLALILVGSTAFREQRARGGRHALEESLVEAIKAALVAANGRTSQQRLAATIGLGAYSLEPR